MNIVTPLEKRNPYKHPKVKPTCLGSLVCLCDQLMWRLILKLIIVELWSHDSLKVGRNSCKPNGLALIVSIVLLQAKFIIIGGCFPTNQWSLLGCHLDHLLNRNYPFLSISTNLNNNIWLNCWIPWELFHQRFIDPNQITQKHILVGGKL